VLTIREQFLISKPAEVFSLLLRLVLNTWS